METLTLNIKTMILNIYIAVARIHTTPRTATSVMLENNVYDNVLYARMLMRRNSSPRVEKVAVTRQ